MWILLENLHLAPPEVLSGLTKQLKRAMLSRGTSITPAVLHIYYIRIIYYSEICNYIRCIILWTKIELVVIRLVQIYMFFKLHLQAQLDISRVFFRC